MCTAKSGVHTPRYFGSRHEDFHNSFHMNDRPYGPRLAYPQTLILRMAGHLEENVSFSPPIWVYHTRLPTIFILYLLNDHTPPHK